MPALPSYSFEGPKWSSSVITWSFATAGGSFSNAINGAYQSTVRAAIARWSQVANITFKEVADSAATNIRVGWSIFSGTQIGETNYSFLPFGSNQAFRSGVTVRLEDPSARPIGTNIKDFYKGSSTTLYQSVLHELGHALGLGHSTDQNSVEFPTIGPGNNDLAGSDIQGIQALYGGAPGVAVSTTTTSPAAQMTLSSSNIAVYRFFDAKNGTQFLTADFSERNTVIATRPDLTYEGLGMGALSSALGDSNAVPVYRFFETKTGSHFFTTSASENAQLVATRPDLVSEPASFFEHATQGVGDIPVYRFFNASTGSHFFTENSAEKTQLQATRPDLALEGIAFYAPSTAAASALPQAANAAEAANPSIVSLNDDEVLVYRFDSADGRQFLTADAAETNATLVDNPGFVFAGPALGSIYNDGSDADAAPVFRFFNIATGDHFLTASATEAAQLVATRVDLVQEQIAFYEHLTQSQGDVPVYRFFDNTTGTHFYTASSAEHASILATRPDMTQEGIAYYAPSV